MTRDDAQRRVRALRQMTVERGATAAEAAMFRAKADALTAKYGLIEPKPGQRARPAPAAGYRGWMAYVPPPDWSFDARTGRGSKNVRVHEYRNVGNWKIEILSEEESP